MFSSSTDSLAFEERSSGDISPTLSRLPPCISATSLCSLSTVSLSEAPPSQLILPAVPPVTVSPYLIPPSTNRTTLTSFPSSISSRPPLLLSVITIYLRIYEILSPPVPLSSGTGVRHGLGLNIPFSALVSPLTFSCFEARPVIIAPQ